MLRVAPPVYFRTQLYQIMHKYLNIFSRNDYDSALNSLKKLQGNDEIIL